MNYPRVTEPTVTPFAELVGADERHISSPSLTSDVLSVLTQLYRSLSDWLDRLPASDRVIDGDGNFWSVDDLDRIEKQSEIEITRASRDVDADSDEDKLPHWSIYCLL